MAYCKKCNAKIDFVRTKKGKFVPVEADHIKIIPNPNGDIFALMDDGVLIKGDEVIDETSDEKFFYARITHFVNCHFAKDFRKPRGDDCE